MPINEPSRLWGRKVAVQFDDILLDGHRVSFEVTKTLKGEPNKATISVYGVDAETYSALLAKKRELVVRLFAGHEIPALVFQGNPVKAGVEFKIQAPERILMVEAKDGYHAYQRGRLKGSYDGEVPLAQIVEESAKQLGLPIGVIDIPGDMRFTQGIHLRGPAHRVLDRLAQSVGSDWSIQNGKLQFLPKSRVRRDSGPLYASSLNNIIGEPTKKEKGIELTVMLDPGLIPGDRFEVRSDVLPLFNGVYKATAVRHSGDNWDQAFYTEIEASEVVEPKPAQKFIGTLFTDQYEALSEYAAISKQYQDEQRQQAHSILWEDPK
jgi:hypothetical protein